MAWLSDSRSWWERFLSATFRGAFNPAVTVGISVMGLSSWSNIWIYLVAEFVGAAVAAGAFKAVSPTDS
jgi:glycerol uptake facilitator-like aquaporin